MWESELTELRQKLYLCVVMGNIGPTTNYSMWEKECSHGSSWHHGFIRVLVLENTKLQSGMLIWDPRMEGPGHLRLSLI